MDQQQSLASIREILELEMQSIQDLIHALDENFPKAIEMILQAPRKIIVTGMGKSGHIANKIAATMSSTGTTAIFMHPAEGLHGDLGVVEKGDLLILLSKSGESDELIALIPSLKKMECKLIIITANRNSTLARNADLVLFTPIEKEACALNLAPTSSTTVALALGDALAITLMRIKNFTPEDFALFHPSGRLGKRLLYKVDDLMLTGAENPICHQQANFEAVLTAFAKGRVNAASVVDDEGNLVGLITGYDIRKAFQEHDNIKGLLAHQIMNPHPQSIQKGTYAIQCLEKMKQSQNAINLLPVLEGTQVVGMISMQAIVRAGL